MSREPLTAEQKTEKSRQAVKKMGYAFLVYGVVLIPVILIWGEHMLKFMPVPFFEGLALKKLYLMTTSLWMIVIGLGLAKCAKWAWYLTFVFIGQAFTYIIVMTHLGYLSVAQMPALLRSEVRYIVANLINMTLAIGLIYFQTRLAFRRP